MLVRITFHAELTATLNGTLCLHHRQDKIDHGVLIRWTKGFGAANTEGHDVVEMFRKSLQKHVRVCSSFVPRVSC